MDKSSLVLEILEKIVIFIILLTILVLQFTILQWTPLSKLQSMGRTSSTSTTIYNLPGRYAWSIAELVGPLNLIYILYTLPPHLHPLSTTTTTSLLGTGLPLTHEVLGLLYIIHYINRAIITPLFSAPSMSPIHLRVAIAMSIFQYLNSTSLAGWLCYNAQYQHQHQQITSLSPPSSNNSAIIAPLSILGLLLFTTGLTTNILAEQTLFTLRRAAAARKSRSEGKPTISYQKVYVVPPATGLFKYILFPHYTAEWLEWTGYWILGGAWGLGWAWSDSAAMMFLVNEVVSMTPRAVEGVKWYRDRFGARSVAGRRGVLPGLL